MISCISVSITDIILELCYQYRNENYFWMQILKQEKATVGLTDERMNSLLVLIC